MPSAELTLTLPSDMAALIERKLRSGVYRSASDVIRDGLQALEDRDDDLEHWLKEHVLAGHAEYEADPSRAVEAEMILARVKARHQERKA